MTGYEILTLIISVVAIIISATSLIRIRKISEQQLELEKINTQLSEKYLSQINEEEKQKTLAHIDVELVQVDENYRFVIKNIGGAEATDIYFSLDACNHNPLVVSDYKQKIPISSLRPNKTVEIMAAKVTNCEHEYGVSVHWLNPDGTQGYDSITVSW